MSRRNILLGVLAIVIIVAALYWYSNSQTASELGSAVTSTVSSTSESDHTQIKPSLKDTSDSSYWGKESDFSWKAGDKIGDFTLVSIDKEFQANWQVSKVQSEFVGTTTVNGTYLYGNDSNEWRFVVDPTEAGRIPKLPFIGGTEVGFTFDNSPSELKGIFKGDKGTAMIEISGYSIGYYKYYLHTSHLVRVVK
jgi:hypothetical protein